MNKRQRLGQHFLNSQSIADEITGAADIGGEDVVLEIGTGHGILTSRLCRLASRVISVEADHELYLQTRARLCFENLTLVNADGFKTDFSFSVFVSNLPYSKSKTALEWLATRRFSRAVIMVQREFADKLLNQTRAISIIANYCFGMERITTVGRHNFDVPPDVDSVVIKLEQKHVLSRDVIRAINLLFSYRRKTVSNILKKFGISSAEQKRLDNLSGDEIIRLGTQISRR